MTLLRVTGLRERRSRRLGETDLAQIFASARTRYLLSASL
jgi:hypothetical protein